MSKAAMQPGYRIEPFPKMRRLAPDIGWVTRNRYVIRGLLEIDVTRPRQLVREHQARSGEKLSFTAFLAACTGQAVELDKGVQAMRNWRGDLVIYDEVDISILVERVRGAEGQGYPLAHIVRAANRKSVGEIHAEIRQVQARPLEGQEAGSLKMLVALPGFIRRLLLWVVAKNPRMRKQNMGTVVLSSVGMFGNHAGWAIGPNFHPLGLLVGGIAQKQSVVDGRIEAREYLYLTLDFDHEVIDGAPAARFAKRLIDLIESGYGLEQLP